ncbi:sigma factor-like helix-turn-helix DNA-binding protein [Zhihengliuella salsuginis]|uniref:RNA polymerase sigma24 factor n=1 Tax=Zhihengliuella salsuginis TaxID=578222 RepID=A0ABQ3GG28_9MICC|nr:sigma factor-like helix-turn-helix DNA-binding protein [Zhihengliuella salsuginis]GHD04975.1 RNA polymerase sigma24 factor [Zhihengliuella salsuginis]
MTPQAALSPGVHAWAVERCRLTDLAYQMLGSLADADDVLAGAGEQVARMSGEEQDAVRSWPAFLTTMVTRRSIDALRAAGRRREAYIGPWLPEPVDTARLPDAEVLDREMLSLGMLHLMEQLAPEARAAYVLKNGFGMSAPQIAEVLESTPAAVRQMLSRAVRRLDADRVPEHEPSVVRALLADLLDAVSTGDVDRTVALLTDDVTWWSDGGGRVRASINPVFGPDRVSRFLVGVFAGRGGVAVEWGDVNGAPVLVLVYDDRRHVLHIEAAAGRVGALRYVANPAKLAGIGG